MAKVFDLDKFKTKQPLKAEQPRARGRKPTSESVRAGSLGVDRASRETYPLTGDPGPYGAAVCLLASPEPHLPAP